MQKPPLKSLTRSRAAAAPNMPSPRLHGLSFTLRTFCACFQLLLQEKVWVFLENGCLPAPSSTLRLQIISLQQGDTKVSLGFQSCAQSKTWECCRKKGQKNKVQPQRGRKSLSRTWSSFWLILISSRPGNRLYIRGAGQREVPLAAVPRCNSGATLRRWHRWLVVPHQGKDLSEAKGGERRVVALMWLFLTPP